MIGRIGIIRTSQKSVRRDVVTFQTSKRYWLRAALPARPRACVRIALATLMSYTYAHVDVITGLRAYLYLYSGPADRVLYRVCTAEIRRIIIYFFFFYKIKEIIIHVFCNKCSTNDGSRSFSKMFNLTKIKIGFIATV